MCLCVSFQAWAHDCSCPLAPLSKPAPLLVVGERSHGVAFLSVWEQASEYYAEQRGQREKEQGRKHKGAKTQQSRAGKRWGAQGIRECVRVRAHEHMCVCARVLKWTTKQKTLVALPCFINTAVCLVWAAPRDRHTDRRTDRHIYIIYSCLRPYLKDNEHK